MTQITDGFEVLFMNFSFSPRGYPLMYHPVNVFGRLMYVFHFFFLIYFYFYFRAVFCLGFCDIPHTCVMQARSHIAFTFPDDCKQYLLPSVWVFGFQGTLLRFCGCALKCLGLSNQKSDVFKTYRSDPVVRG